MPTVKRKQRRAGARYWQCPYCQAVYESLDEATLHIHREHRHGSRVPEGARPKE